MRKKLKKLHNKRLTFTAYIERFGTKSAFRGDPIPTILLLNICCFDTGEVVSDHLWFTKGKSWLPFNPGDKIQFDARVTTYEKGYKGYRDDIYDCPVTIDYRLERPTKIKKID